MSFARASVLTLVVVGLGASSSSCNERFEYDVPRGGASGSGGARDANAGAVASGDACGSGPACPAALRCVSEICVECASDADCAGSDFERCEPILHRCVQCLTAADCTSDHGCDRIANRCLRTCSDDLPCPPDAHGCDEKRMVCYACDEDRECEDSPIGPYCAADGRGCVECRGGEGCAAEELCDELTGACVACRDARDCTSGLCDPKSHTCLTPS